MKKNQATSTPILKVFTQGLQLLLLNRVIIAKLSFVPFVITLITLVFMRFVQGDIGIFMLPIIQLPSNFIIGLQCAVLLRFFVLNEHPLIADAVLKKQRNLFIGRAALAYAVVLYITTGLYAVMSELEGVMKQSPDAIAPYMPFVIAGMAGFFWCVRFLWLHVPLALDLSVRAFYKNVGGWAGSLRIFALFGLCSIVLNFITSISRAMVYAVLHNVSAGLTLALGDVILAITTIILAAFFTCVTVIALQDYKS